MNVFFETEHLVVRELEPEDAMRLYENHAEEKVMKWFPNESYADINEAEDDPYGNGMLVYKWVVR